MKRLRLKKSAGFTLLPVILTMSLIAAIAFLLNRDNGINAEMYADQADLTRARYAAEAGLQAVNYKVQSVGCGGILSFYPSSGVSPVSNNNFGGGSYSAYGNSNWLVPPTTLTSTGTYNGSSVTLTRNNVVTYQSGYKTYTLQPNATAGKDTYINSAFPSRSYGSDTSLRLWTGRYEPLLQFDLSAFPVGSKAAPWFDTLSGTLKPGAELGLYLISNPSATGVNMDILPITRSWIEGTTNNTANGASWNTYDGINAWSSPGVGYDAALVASTPYAATLGWKTWDITGMANSWLSGRYPNNGLWLRPSGTAVGDAQFASSDNSTATQWPKISFNYLLPCGTTGPTNTPTQTTVTLNPVADSHMDNGAVQKNFNYGAASTLIVHGGGRSTRALFRFNTATIPPGSTIISATLRSYVSYISDNKTTRNIQAYTLTES